MAVLDCWWLSRQFGPLRPGWSYAELWFKVKHVPLDCHMPSTHRWHPCKHTYTLRLHFPAPVSPLHCDKHTHTRTPYTECLLNQQCHHTISVDWLLGWCGGTCQSAVSAIIANNQFVRWGTGFCAHALSISHHAFPRAAYTHVCGVAARGEIRCQLVCHGNGEHVWLWQTGVLDDCTLDSCTHTHEHTHRHNAYRNHREWTRAELHEKWLKLLYKYFMVLKWIQTGGQ